jgi:hypothetical protein
MKHATPRTLKTMAPLLAQLRGFVTLRERKPGAFYRGSAAFLHFHEDPAGIFADVKVAGSGFTRVPVATVEQRTKFLELVADILGVGTG